MIKHIFSFFLFLFFLTSPDSRASAVLADTSVITVRTPPAEKQAELFSDDDFRYDKKGTPPSSWWDRFWQWVGDLLDEAFSTKTGNAVILALKWILIAAALGLVIWLILKNDVRALFYRGSKSSDIDFVEMTEDINKINFDKMIEEEILKKNFRRAVRLYFLKSLKLLSDNELIVWKPDKTNYDFYTELKEPVQTDFRRISILYDYVWYGSFPIDENEFQNAKSKFSEFHEMIFKN